MGWGRLDHGLVLPRSREPGRGFVRRLASRSAAGSAVSSAQGQSSAGSTQRQAELSSPWPSARERGGGGDAIPSQTCPRHFGASPRWLRASSAHPRGRDHTGFVDLSVPLSHPCPAKPARTLSASHQGWVMGMYWAWGALPKTRGVLPPPRGPGMPSAL